LIGLAKPIQEPPYVGKANPSQIGEVLSGLPNTGIAIVAVFPALALPAGRRAAES
jgi:hypothetical protein